MSCEREEGKFIIHYHGRKTETKQEKGKGEEGVAGDEGGEHEGMKEVDIKEEK